MKEVKREVKRKINDTIIEVDLKTKKLKPSLINDMRYKYKRQVDTQDYIFLTAFCNACDLNEPEVIEIHHIDKDRSNNNISNLVSLCPTCHKLHHRGIIDRIW